MAKNKPKKKQNKKTSRKKRIKKQSIYSRDDQPVNIKILAKILF